MNDDTQGVDRTQNPEQPIPRLSVVMPAYNAGPYIGRAIDSILGQTFADFELIIVDDASTDDTAEIAEKKSESDQRISVVRSLINLGVAEATNVGVAQARAELIGRMDADDISVPTRFEKQLKMLDANPHFAVVGSFASHTNDNEVILSLSRTGPPSEAAYQELRDAGKPTMVFGGTALFRRELFDQVGGYDRSIPRAVDLELFDRMSDYGPVVAVPEPLLLYRMHGAGLVSRAFYEGRQVHRFVEARRMARHQGNDPMSLEEFIQWEDSLSRWKRVRIQLDDSVQFHYREAGMAYGRGERWPFFRHLSVAFASNPSYVIRRIWEQRLSPAARRR